MADLNEPKKETVRITLPPRPPPQPTPPIEKERSRINLPNRPPGPPGGAKPPATDLRPQSSGPEPLPPAGGASPPRPPVPSKGPPPTSGLKPPLPPPPGGLKAPVPPPPPPGLKQSSPPAPPASVAAALAKPAFPPVNLPLENRGIAQTGARKETARIADSPMKATVKLGSVQPVSIPAAPFIRSAPPAAAKPPQRLVETIPTQLCWVLLAISALILLIQLWTYFA
jgi:hypothetical protein